MSDIGPVIGHSPQIFRQSVVALPGTWKDGTLGVRAGSGTRDLAPELRHQLCDSFITLNVMNALHGLNARGRRHPDREGSRGSDATAACSTKRTSSRDDRSLGVGATGPPLDAVSELVAECGLDLVLRITEHDTTLADRVREQLVLSPPKRLARLLPPESTRDAKRALRWLAIAGSARGHLRVTLADDQSHLLRALLRNGVEFVVVGGVAAQLRGWEGATADLDIAVASEESNAERINRPRGASRNAPGLRARTLT
jgi:hypothetical protein